jgi:hypothetical protein
VLCGSVRSTLTCRRAPSGASLHHGLEGKRHPRRRRTWARSRDPLVGIAVVLAIVVAAVALDRVVRNATGEGRPSTVTASSSLPLVQHGSRSDITVVDGDTVRSGGAIYRLVGFDTPERGDRALCDHERELAERASARLRSLVASLRSSGRPVPAGRAPKAHAHATSAAGAPT